MLCNPFYISKILRKGELYPHKYPIFIDLKTFEKCQNVRNKKD
ncbi:hypothetical protein [Candidatus Endomicrobiellum devescovinae]